MTNAPQPIATLKTCYRCSYEAETAETKCPKCRKKLWTVAETRVLGGVLAGLGAFLLIVMGSITVFTIGVINNDGRSAAGTKFTGTKEEMYMIFGIFGFVLLFGFLAFISGLWQLIYGRRNRTLVWVIIGMAVIFAVIGAFARWTTGG